MTMHTLKRGHHETNCRGGARMFDRHRPMTRANNRAVCHFERSAHDAAMRGFHVATGRLPDGRRVNIIRAPGERRPAGGINRLKPLIQRDLRLPPGPATTAQARRWRRQMDSREVVRCLT